MQRYTYKVTGDFGSEVGTVTDNRTGEIVKQWKGSGPGNISVQVACVNEVKYQMHRFSPAAMEYWQTQRDK
tara:strand:+ start:940 stop:1152 length:213 start_codon:yes stop_codon:yes gene_type:complete